MSRKQRTKLKTLVRIVKTPTGEAPLAVRKAWVGLVLPCDPYVGVPTDALDSGVVTGKKVRCNSSDFSISEASALRILKKANPKAAAWWEARGHPKYGWNFGFSENEARAISNIRRQKIVEVPGEAMGHTDR